jgi:DNA polymerase III delta prime subunit
MKNHIIVAGPSSVNKTPKAHVLARELGGLFNTTSYNYLVSSHFGFSEMLMGRPASIIISDVPNRSWAYDFVKRLASMDKVPFDLPSKPFTMRDMPHLIFILNSPEPIGRHFAERNFRIINMGY